MCYTDLKSKFGGIEMILNDRHSDMKSLFILSGMKQRTYARQKSKNEGCVSVTVRRNSQSIPKSFVKICEDLGYDIKLKYVKK